MERGIVREKGFQSIHIVRPGY